MSTQLKVLVSVTEMTHGRKNIKSEIGLALFDLSKDMGEQMNVAEANPKTVKSVTEKIRNHENRPWRWGGSTGTGQPRLWVADYSRIDFLPGSKIRINFFT